MQHPDPERYTAAWCGRSTEALLAFYAENACCIVNDGDPVVGRAAMGEVMQGFIDAFPDLEIRMEAFRATDEAAVYVWRLLGTHLESGQSVDLEGWEAWRLNRDGQILEMRGYFDVEDYARQIGEP